MLCHICVLFFWCTMITCGAPVTDGRILKYLAKFGYLQPKVLQPNSQISYSKMKTMIEVALTNFQKFYGLPPTGRMDEATDRAMQLPRCGEKDMLSVEEQYIHKERNAHWGEPWTKHDLTYRIHRYPQRSVLSQAAVDEEVALAFAAWASVTDLVFRHVSEKADINISFFRGQHEDGNPFDGKGMILGHANKPPGGMVHFDDDEPWTIRRYNGQNLFLVAVHEFGHALGLEHSVVKGSIMQPMLNRGYEPNFMLHDDDVKRVQLLYGRRRHHPPDLCINSSFDAIFENPDGIIYVLKGKYYWKLSPDGFVNNYPLLISHHWTELPGDIDTAFATSSGTTYFFKGTMYWVYTYTRLHPGHPKLISEGWPGIPSDLDAATWYTNSVFYFFKEDMYWIYNSHQTSHVNGSRPMTEWGNIAGDLDDVMYIRSGYIYFFNKGNYYRFNCKTKLVDSGWPDQPHYPREVGPWWFKCSSKETKT